MARPAGSRSSGTTEEEVRPAGTLDQLRREFRLDLEVLRDIPHVGDQIAWVAAPRRKRELIVKLVEDVGHRIGAVIHILAQALGPEDLLVLSPGRIPHRDFVMNPPEKSLFDELGGIEVRREDQQAVERYRELPPGVESQIVDPLVQRDDPAVE